MLSNFTVSTLVSTFISVALSTILDTEAQIPNYFLQLAVHAIVCK